MKKEREGGLREMGMLLCWRLVNDSNTCLEGAEDCRGAGFDFRYLAFFAEFGAGEYYIAHDVLEGLWLGERRGADGDFYKGLIQLAGAWVHVGKGRRQPALALLDLALKRLEPYPVWHLGVDLGGLRDAVGRWRAAIAEARPGPAGLEGAELRVLGRPVISGPAGR